MMTSMDQSFQCLPAQALQPSPDNTLLGLHNVAATRAIESYWLARTPHFALMQRAGAAAARLTLAIAPHAQRIWIACGFGNNGGDGLQAAALLQQWGKSTYVSLQAQPEQLPPDAYTAWQHAVAAGVQFVENPPALSADDLCIDALLGIGATRAPSPQLQFYIAAMNAADCPTLALDIPTGLQADTGVAFNDCIQAQHTLSFLTIKPGQVTASGRDACGQIWWHGLEVLPAPDRTQASAWLQGASFATVRPTPPTNLAHHSSHKGSFGDVCIIGGAPQMAGAAVLAGQAALHAGAGRVYVRLLHSPPQPSPVAELMVSSALEGALPLSSAVVVCGCGGGDAVEQVLPQVLAQSPKLVLDADALNAVARNPTLRQAVQTRAAQAFSTVITPHPLEAARLLQCSVQEVQSNRIHAAQQLAQHLQCHVVLKGSGSVLASPHHPNVTINFTGNAHLATAGTGDVLAGCMGAMWAQHPQHVEAAVQAAVLQHGWVANQWTSGTLTASALATGLQRWPVPY